MASTNQGMQNLISTVNRIQNALADAGLPLESLDLPQIAVVGGQSSGKSSVLENFVGRDFLPRGKGIVTRCPLVFQMIPDKQEYAEFSHIPQKKFEDFQEVRDEIQRRTNHLTNSKTAISKEPIRLTWFSPQVLELTLVDLPGMTRVAMDGQPEDIEQQIRDLVFEYIKKQNALILAVTPANSDIANSDALKIAKEVDPNGNRTIGILTKIDLMDKGTDARNILENRAYRLKKGFIGLVNRSQKDIDENKNIKEAQEEEDTFFQEHLAYSNMADNMGSKYLQKRLNRELLEHIQNKLPEFKASVTKEHYEAKEKLKKMNYFDKDSDLWGKKQIISLVTCFGASFSDELEGHSYEINRNKPITCGVKINECINQQLSENLKAVAKVNSELNLHNLQRNLQGFRDTVHPPEEILEIVAKDLLINFKRPIDIAVETVTAILAQDIETFANDHELARFPRLKNFMLNNLKDKLRKQETKTKAQLHKYMKAQRAYVNQRHPEFLERKHKLGFSAYFAGLEQWNKADPEVNFNRIKKELFNTKPKIVLIASTNVNIETQHESLYHGLVHVNMVNGLQKQMNFFLNSEFLVWQIADPTPGSITPDGYVTVHSGSTRLEGLKLEEDVKTKKIFISKLNKPGRTEIIFPSDHETTQWCGAFASVGVEVHRNANVIKEPNGPGEMERTICMIKDYMEVVEISIRDITPKYIIQYVVQSIRKYLTKGKLLAEVLQNDTAVLMEGNEVEEEKERLVQIFRATEKALEILCSASQS